jgi:hypothetical protein
MVTMRLEFGIEGIPDKPSALPRLRRQDIVNLKETFMIRFGAIATAALTILCLGPLSSASAQSLQQQVVGTWTLTAGMEQRPDGTKVTPWQTGRLMLDANGNLAFFLIGRDRPKAGNDPRVPVGPIVAYYGTYTVNDAEKSLTWKMEHASFPGFDGGERKQTVVIAGDIMTTTGSPVQTPQGAIIPINEWKRVQ